jgi:hypothetical protein
MQEQIDWEKLSAQFDPEDLEWRVQSCGKKNDKVWALVMPYVTSRAIMERLDAVCGPQNWKNGFEPGPCGGVVCVISIRVDGAWIGKWDGADQEEQSEGGQKIDKVKSALSSAMKRAAVQWGIGRYLYKIQPAFAQVHDQGSEWGKTKDGTVFRWDPPGSGGGGEPPRRGGRQRQSKPFTAERAENAEGARGSEKAMELGIDAARAEMDRAKKPKELFEWMTGNRGRLGVCRKEAMEYFNRRMQELKAA